MISGTVAIVGRPNVGKSTLFNRLTRSKTSIIDDCPGVTRDRIYGTAYYQKEKTSGFNIIDTGGFETESFNFQPFEENLVWKQSQQAIEESDLVLFLLDGKHGLHQHDQIICRYLQDREKKVLFVVNKIDGEEQGILSYEFFKLGADTNFINVSAAHNKGIKELLAAVKKSMDLIPKLSKQQSYLEGTKIALIGRPNAGKSSILNRLIGEERSLVSPIPGTTRDSIDSTFMYHGEPYVLIDTAGIRRRTKVKETLEVQSVVRSLRAIERADVIIHVIDATVGITDQDARLIHMAVDRYKPILLVINKWDLIPDKDSSTLKNYTNNIKERYLKDLSFIPLAFVSCLENKRVHSILEQVKNLIQQNNHKAPTARINESLERIVSTHSPHLVKKFAKRIKFYYATQIASNPPTIIIKANAAKEIQESYKRYMLKTLRKDLGFTQVPVKMIIQKKSETKPKDQAHG